MIEAKYLKIGNLAIDTTNKKIIEVEEIGQIIIRVSPQHLLRHQRLKYKDLQFTDINPIPITEEWLLKLGFEIDWIISHETEYFNLIQEGSNYFYTDDQHHYTSKEIKYIHQLQNLFFAITGEELTIKP